MEAPGIFNASVLSLRNKIADDDKMTLTIKLSSKLKRVPFYIESKLIKGCYGSRTRFVARGQ